MHHKSPAFTLIELIIGITILSLLAVALLAALDPIEQISKARDTAKRNLAVELHGAYVRYNANKDVYPDRLATAIATAEIAQDKTATYLDNERLATTNMLTRDIQELITAGELKPNFLQAAGSNLSSLRVMAIRQDSSTFLSICFKPQSKLELQKQGLFKVDGLTIASSITGQWLNAPTVDSGSGGCSLAGATNRTSCVYCAQ